MTTITRRQYRWLMQVVWLFGIIGLLGCGGGLETATPAVDTAAPIMTSTRPPASPTPVLSATLRSAAATATKTTLPPTQTAIPSATNAEALKVDDLAPGTYIVYYGERLGGSNGNRVDGLHVVSIDGEYEGLLIADAWPAASLFRPEWWVAYAARDDSDGFPTLFIKDLTDASIQKLSVGPVSIGPTWSADGTQLLYECGDACLYSLADSTTQSLRLAGPTEGTGVSSLLWSPDGQLIAYYRRGEMGEFEGPLILEAECLSRVSACVQPDRKLPDVRGEMAWSPDSQVLAVGRYNSEYAIDLYDVATGDLLATLPLDPEAGYASSLIWSVNGDDLIFTQNHSNSIFSIPVAGGPQQTLYSEMQPQNILVSFTFNVD